MRVLGIDPGTVGGACALFCAGEVVATVPGGLFDMPTTGKDKKNEVDCQRLRDLVWDLRPDVCYVEQITAWMPEARDQRGEKIDGAVERWGATSHLKLIGAFFSAKAVVSCLGIDVREVNAKTWKGAYGLPGGRENKEHSRQTVISRWPSVEPFVRRKKDTNRAEAFLIAAYGAGIETGTITRERFRSELVLKVRRRVLVDEDIPE